MTDPLKAISIRQPWAHAIIYWGKDIENRTWKTKHRGELLIHASQTIDKKAVEDLRAAGYPIPDQFETGGIVGKVEVVDCVTESDSLWYQGQVGFVLKNPQPLPFQKMKGQLGIYKVK